MSGAEKMNEISEVARAYYDGGKEDKKKLVQQFFKCLDSNGDGKISLQEYKKYVNPSFSSEHVFRQLDENEDGTLDFDEVLALYYMDKVSIPRCGGCHDMLLSSYFSCLPCQGKNSFFLCCNCYGGRKFNHRLSSSEFMDTRALLKLMDQFMAHAEVQHNRENYDADGKTEGSTSRKRSKSDTVAATLEALNTGLCIGGAVVTLGTIAATTGCCIM